MLGTIWACHAGVREWVDAKKQLLSILTGSLLALVPWMQVSRAVKQNVQLSLCTLAAVVAAGIAIHLVYLAVNITAVNVLNLGGHGEEGTEVADAAAFKACVTSPFLSIAQHCVNSTLHEQADSWHLCSRMHGLSTSTMRVVLMCNCVLRVLCGTNLYPVQTTDPHVCLCNAMLAPGCRSGHSEGHHPGCQSENATHCSHSAQWPGQPAEGADWAGSHSMRDRAPVSDSGGLPSGQLLAAI